VGPMLDSMLRRAGRSWGVGSRFTPVAVVLACLGAPAGAWADHPGSEPDGHVPAVVENALGDDVVELENGLFEVDPRRGPPLTTHGPDTASEIAPSHGQTLGPGDPERRPICATDYYQQVLYAHRATDPNRIAAVRGQIQSTIRRINAVLNEEALATGGITADYKLLCDSTGEVRVDSFTIASNGTSYDSVVTAARNAGFNKSNVDYTIFFDYDHPNYCGVGSFSSDESPGIGNANNAGGDYGISQADCWNGLTVMHENGHNQGAVQYGAPYSTGDGAHCIDENDVMCYSPDGGDLNQGGTVQLCTDRLYFDCGHDSYFDVDPEPGDYLASNWNMGSPVNRFIEFDSEWTPPPAPPSAPAEPSPPAAQPPPEQSSAADDGVTKLANRVPFADTAASGGEWKRYTVRVPRGSTKLVVKLDCAAECSDQLDLYLRSRDETTLTEYDCRSTSASSDEACRVRTPRRGRWQIGVHTAEGPGGSEYEIVARSRG
jgi:Bacterial pre-peptidase C-terminal domain/Metallo-peptidase family M12B Reprolysin-like